MAFLNPAENSESGQCVLLVRNIKCYDGLDSIVVQSGPLKDSEFSTPVMEGYPGVTVSLKRVELKTLFKPLIHRWGLFMRARDEESDPLTKEHAQLHYGILVEELYNTISLKNDLILNGMITYDLLWTIFKPDAPIYTVQDGHQ